MDSHFHAQLDRYYDQLDRLDHLAEQQPLTTWYVTTSEWEEHAEDQAKLDELLAYAVLDGLTAKVESVPF